MIRELLSRVLSTSMRSERFAQQLLVTGLVFVVLGAGGWAWFDQSGFSKGALTGGAVAVVVALVLLVRGRSARGNGR